MPFPRSGLRFSVASEPTQKFLTPLKFPKGIDHSLKKRVAKAYAEARGSSVIAMRKTRWRAIVPVAVEREIPVELAPEFDVVRRVEIELNSSRIRNGRKQIAADGQSRPIEVEQFYLRS